MDNLLYKIVDEYKALPEVKAIAIGGSSTAKTSDDKSDIDIYVFTDKGISLEIRNQIVQKYSTKYEVGGEYFGSGDEYFVDDLGQQFDVMYWDINWFNSIVENVWEKCYPSNGYTTCFLYTLNNFNIVYDTDNWLLVLKDKLKKDYPEQLQKNIIQRNIMLMKDKPFASYYEQIEKALYRSDLNSVNHRVSAFLASYFDVIFAINKLLHPGEKRLLGYAKKHCKILPNDFEINVLKLLEQPNEKTLQILDKIIENLRLIIT